MAREARIERHATQSFVAEKRARAGWKRVRLRAGWHRPYLEFVTADQRRPYADWLRGYFAAEE
jgi:hypothetical protein